MVRQAATWGEAVQVAGTASAKALRQERGGTFQGMAEAGVAGTERAVGEWEEVRAER